jgi:clusterin-associated protein 1
MSFRELRDFTEIMRALGYRQLISVENFRTPNFYLMADVLHWLVLRYDNSPELDPDISTEDSRINYLKSVAQFMSNKAHVKLNIKQLYRADGHAVRELLKICRILYNAVQIHPSEIDATAEVNMASKMEELKDSKNLANEIVESGAKLNTLLANEEKLKINRDRALKFLNSISMNLDSDSHDQIERNVRQEISLITERISEYEKLLVDLEKEEKSLVVKIEKKKRALIGAEKRLRNHKKIRPDYMEDYEQAEADLKAEYETYLERFRNLYYLESELEKYHTQEAERKAEADKRLSRMQKRLKAAAEAEHHGTHGGMLLDSDSDDEKNRNKPQRRRNAQAARLRGRMALDADDTEEESEEDDSDEEGKLGARTRGAMGGRRMPGGSDSEESEYYSDNGGDGTPSDGEEDYESEESEDSNDGNV